MRLRANDLTAKLANQFQTLKMTFNLRLSNVSRQPHVLLYSEVPSPEDNDIRRSALSGLINITERV